MLERILEYVFLKQNCDFEHKLILIIVKYEIIILLILTNWYLQLKADTTYSSVSHGSANTGCDSYKSYDMKHMILLV